MTPAETPSEPPAPPRTAVVVLAAGEGRRVGAAGNKVLLPLAGRPVFVWSLLTARQVGYVDRLLLVIREQDRAEVTEELARHLPGTDVTLVVGGDSRHGSEWNALQVLADDIDAGRIDVVAIHDAARPLAEPRLFTDVVGAAAVHGAALPTVDQHGLLARSDDASREHGAGTLVAVQTPQAFRAGPLLDAYRRAAEDTFVGTDTARCVEEYTDLAIHAVPSTAANLKITFPDDVAIAERLLG